MRAIVVLCRCVTDPFSREHFVMSDEGNGNVIILPRRRMRSRIAALRRLPLCRRRSAFGVASAGESTISEYELQAFVDDALDPVQRDRVRTFLIRHPSAAADAASYCHQNRMLRELRPEGTPLSPALGYLTAQLARRLALARGRRVLVWGAATALLAGTAAAALGGASIATMPPILLTAGR